MTTEISHLGKITIWIKAMAAKQGYHLNLYWTVYVLGPGYII